MGLSAEKKLGTRADANPNDKTMQFPFHKLAATRGPAALLHVRPSAALDPVHPSSQQQSGTSFCGIGLDKNEGGGVAGGNVQPVQWGSLEARQRERER